MQSEQQVYPAGAVSAPHFHSIFLQQVQALVEHNCHDPHFSVQALALAIPLSPSQLYRRIKKLTGLSPVLYLRSLRLQKSIPLLANTDLTIAEVAYKTGFSDPAYFSRSFSFEYGISPMEFRRRNNPCLWLNSPKAILA